MTIGPIPVCPPNVAFTLPFKRWILAVGLMFLVPATATLVGCGSSAPAPDAPPSTNETMPSPPAAAPEPTATSVPTPTPLPPTPEPTATAVPIPTPLPPTPTATAEPTASPVPPTPAPALTEDIADKVGRRWAQDNLDLIVDEIVALLLDQVPGLNQLPSVELTAQVTDNLALNFALPSRISPGVYRVAITAQTSFELKLPLIGVKVYTVTVPINLDVDVESRTVTNWELDTLSAAIQEFGKNQ